MIGEYTGKIVTTFLPTGDYVSPGFLVILPDACFSYLIIGDKKYSQWRYSRREIPHNRYVDCRHPGVGFLNRDEAHILYNTALKFRGKQALEIGCWLGWSACHLALAGVKLDVIDPLLENAQVYESVSEALKAANVLDSVNLISGYSPEAVERLAEHRKWSLIFIDGNHEAPGPLNDAIICEKFAAEDSLILFHDLASPDVAQGLDYFKQKGWNTLVYQTAQIMGVAWRGNVEPVQHQPDPNIQWSLPPHLQEYTVSSSAMKSIEQQSAINSSESPLIPFQLKEFNIIIIPDWNQPDEVIYTNLKQAFTLILTHPKTSEINLMIESQDISEEDASLLISGVAMDIMMENNIEVDQEPHICFIQNLSRRQWSALIPRLQGRIQLSHENEKLIDQIADLPILTLDSDTQSLKPPSLNPYQSTILQLVDNNPGQMSVEEYLYLTDIIAQRKPCNLLIFGVGKDSQLWLQVNQGGKTIFLEDSLEWLNQVKQNIPTMEAYPVEYKTQLKQGLNLLVQYSQGIDCLEMTLPDHITTTEWDVIFVDAPAGYAEQLPGRMKSIYTASQLAARNSKVDIFVHDCDRLIETLYSGYFLHDDNLVTQIYKLRHYRMVNHQASTEK